MNNIIENNAKQRKFWLSKFGENYINRNKSMDELNQFYEQQTGTTKEQIFQNFFDGIERKSKILELGCNIGLNLSILRKMRFKNMYGIELNKKAIEIGKKENPDVTFIHSSIEEFDPKGKKYDLVFTSGVLIHIHPSSLHSIMKKIVNLTKEYIFGFEYYADRQVEIVYRGSSNVCWKQNFPLLFKKLFPSIKTVKEEKIHYKKENLCDIAYLLRKT